MYLCVRASRIGQQVTILQVALFYSSIFFLPPDIHNIETCAWLFRLAAFRSFLRFITESAEEEVTGQQSAPEFVSNEAYTCAHEFRFRCSGNQTSAQRNKGEIHAHACSAFCKCNQTCRLCFFASGFRRSPSRCCASTRRVCRSAGRPARRECRHYPGTVPASDHGMATAGEILRILAP